MLMPAGRPQGGVPLRPEEQLADQSQRRPGTPSGAPAEATDGDGRRFCPSEVLACSVLAQAGVLSAWIPATDASAKRCSSTSVS